MITTVILWTCVGVFIATAVIAVLSLIGKLQIEARYKAALFTSLILEVVIVGIGIFSGKIDPSHLTPGNTNETEAYYKLSQEMKVITDRVKHRFDEGNFTAGLPELALLFDQLGDKLAPTADAFYLKGRLAEHRGEWSDAATNYEIALQIKPTYLDAMIRAGSTRTKIKDYENAQVLFNSADQLARDLADEPTTYRIANGRQNLERRYGAFLLEVGRKEAAQEHFVKALKIVQSMETMTPQNKNPVGEKSARYRIFWEWRRYEEAIAEVRALTKESKNVTYMEDLAAILIEKSDSASILEARSILENLHSQGQASGYAVASLAEASALIPTSNDKRITLLEAISRAIVTEEVNVEPDPYLYYAKAMLNRSLDRRAEATDALDEAIYRERSRLRNVFTFDAVRLAKYQGLKAQWSVDDQAIAVAKPTPST